MKCQLTVLLLGIDVALLLLFGVPGIASGEAEWITKPPAGSRFGAAGFWDPSAQRLIVHGGRGANIVRGDLWSYDPMSDAWQLLHTGDPILGAHSIVPITGTSSAVAFGGSSEVGGSLSNRTFRLDLVPYPQWTELHPSGVLPSPRDFVVAVYDTHRGRLVVFGGYDGGYLNDVWALDPTGDGDWTEIVPAGTPPAFGEGVCGDYEPVGDRLLVWTGEGDLGLWQLEFSPTATWSPVSTDGVPPSARSGATAMYDSTQQRLLILGGLAAPDSTCRVWQLTLPEEGTPTWSELFPTGTPPPDQWHPVIGRDTAANRIFVAAGAWSQIDCDVWELQLSPDLAWAKRTAPAPPFIYGQSVVEDEEGGRFLAFGGSVSTFVARGSDEVWSLSVDETAVWSEVEVEGTRPALRLRHGAVLDAEHDRMVIFGGNTQSTRYNDAWELVLNGAPSWNLLNPLGTPPSARSNFTTVHDGEQNRMIIFGGDDGVPRNDLWALSLRSPETWTVLSPASSPPTGRFGATAVLADDAMIVFGGYDGSAYLADLWSLDLSSLEWTQMAPDGSAAPPARRRHTAIYDPSRNRMVVFGGSNESGILNDAWELTLGDPPVWRQLTHSGDVPGGEASHAAVYDAAVDGMLVVGGNSNQVQVCLFSGTSAAGEADLTWGIGLFPNPSRRDLILRLPDGIAHDSHAWIVDPSGRIVRNLELSPPGAPQTWDGKDDFGSLVPSGVYFIRVATDHGPATGRIVRVR